MYLVDTAVLSEIIRPEPDPKVDAWFRVQEERNLYVSVVSLGELQRGVSLLPTGKRQSALQRWVDTVIASYADRILRIDLETMIRWGRVTAVLSKQGVNPPLADGLIAVSALARDFTVVTRNVRDFEAFGVKLLNPWD